MQYQANLAGHLLELSVDRALAVNSSSPALGAGLRVNIALPQAPLHDGYRVMSYPLVMGKANNVMGNCKC